MKEEKSKRVLLGMSGGTDSSVAAILLQDAGYEVTGVTFRFYEKEGDTAYLDDARTLCSRLHIPHIAYDVRDMFRKRIITYFIGEYMKGRTPVPCTLCNNQLKWPLLQRLADEHGIPFIASGHYVRKRLIGRRWHIIQGADPDKDQSFFLWGLPQNIIKRMLLPLGELTKTRVREIASERGFLKVASKRDSLGVCFCPGDYRTYLRKHTQTGDIVPGPYFDEQRNYMGMHEGYPFYTIGQRRGLGIYLNKALFVKETIPEENAVILADNLRSLEHTAFYLSHWHLPHPEAVFDPQAELIVKIRYRKQANRCSVSLASDNRLYVHLHEPLASIACGQAAVFYRKEVVLGGGIIDSTE